MRLVRYGNLSTKENIKETREKLEILTCKKPGEDLKLSKETSLV